MVIKAVVIDIGGILINENSRESRALVAKKFGFNESAFWVYAKKVLDRSYRGKLDAKDFFAGLISELELDADASDMVEAWVDGREKTSSMNDVVLETLEGLRGKYVIGALTNSTILNESIGLRKNCYGLFDVKVISCEVGTKKPDKKIYEILIKKMAEKDVKAEEIVFVDDKPENLGPAEKLGIKTILFEDSEQMIRDFREMGVGC